MNNVSLNRDTSDAALTSRWTNFRDPAAFESLVLRHGGLMRRVALVALGTAAHRDPGLLDDAVQDACQRLLAALRSYRGEASVPAFLAAVSRRAALDLLRKRLRHEARGLRAAALAAPPDEECADPARLAIRSAMALDVRAALSMLPEPERSLLYLRDAEGLDIASLAASFRLPEGTIKSKLARARAKVRVTVLKNWRNP